MADNRMQDLLAEIGKPKLNWLVARVFKVNPNGTCTLSYSGGFIYNVSSMDHYVPVVGDVVHALSFEPQGVLILGANSNTTGVDPVEPVAQTPTVITPVSTATYTYATETWTPGFLQQGPGLLAGWRYLFTAFVPLYRTIFQQVEVEITRVSGGPPELVRFLGAVPEIPPGPPWQAPLTDAGVPTWVSVPLGWGQELLTGDVDGIGIISSGQDGVYSGTGRVRLTPLSVTI
jgi:hypothetical protein